MLAMALNLQPSSQESNWLIRVRSLKQVPSQVLVP